MGSTVIALALVKQGPGDVLLCAQVPGIELTPGSGVTNPLAGASSSKVKEMSIRGSTSP